MARQKNVKGCMPRILSEDNEGVIERAAREGIPKNTRKREIDSPSTVTGSGAKLKKIKAIIPKPPASKCFILRIVVDEGRTLDQPPCV